jgi:CBS domain-containing protein
MKVKELMTTSVECVLPHTSLRTAARKMSELGVGSLLIVENEQLLGIITDRDISCFAVAMGHSPNDTEVQKIMTRTVTRCYQDQDINEAAELMEKAHIRRLTIMDPNDQVSGVLSVDDLARVSHELAGAVLEAATPIH